MTKTRRLMMELLLGRCSEIPQIQAMAKEMGVEDTRFPKKDSDCILCGLCVRVCQERMGINAIDFVGRGTEKIIAPAYERHSVRCIVCGACTTVCPIDTVDLSKVSEKPVRTIPSEFEMNIGERPSIYIPYPQAVPLTAVIDPDSGRLQVDPVSVRDNLQVALATVPRLAGVDLIRTWPAIVNGTADWRPILGEAPMARGFYMCMFPWMGFTAGPICARIVADLARGRQPEIDVRGFGLSI